MIEIINNRFFKDWLAGLLSYQKNNYIQNGLDKPTLYTPANQKEVLKYFPNKKEVQKYFPNKGDSIQWGNSKPLIIGYYSDPKVMIMPLDILNPSKNTSFILNSGKNNSNSTLDTKIIKSVNVLSYNDKFPEFEGSVHVNHQQMIKKQKILKLIEKNLLVDRLIQKDYAPINALSYSNKVREVFSSKHLGEYLGFDINRMFMVPLQDLPLFFHKLLIEISLVYLTKTWDFERYMYKRFNMMVYFSKESRLPKGLTNIGCFQNVLHCKDTFTTMYANKEIIYSEMYPETRHCKIYPIYTEKSKTLLGEDGDSIHPGGFQMFTFSTMKIKDDAY